MKKIFKKYIILALGSCLLFSCTKDFDKINTDPNRPKEITPGVMLGQLQYRMVNSVLSDSRFFTHELMQVDAPRVSPGGGGVHRYIIAPGEGIWTSFYTYMADVEDIYKMADGLQDNNYKAIALVYKSWAFSILTDLYGDIPYSEATKGGEANFLPVFDQQKDIYPKLLDNLALANDLFDASKPLTYGGDMLYKSATTAAAVNPGIVKWKKFCNSLRLRLLLRLTKRQGEIDVRSQISAMLADPQKYPMFGSNDDEAIFRYTGAFPYYNPFYNTRTLEWRDGAYFTEFFINKMNADNDPRRAVLANQVTVNGSQQYRGIKSGYAAGVEYAVGDNSSYLDALKTAPNLGIMMTYAELLFIKAELALNGYNTGGTAEEFYKNGILASMKQWNATVPAGYLDQAGVVYKTTGTTEEQLEQIMLQKYIAFVFVDYQSWFEKRRTGYPVLPRGEGIPATRQFPRRVPYPPYLQSLNPAHLAAAVATMGGDNTDIRVWWDK